MIGDQCALGVRTYVQALRFSLLRSSMLSGSSNCVFLKRLRRSAIFWFSVSKLAWIFLSSWSSRSFAFTCWAKNFSILVEAGLLLRRSPSMFRKCLFWKSIWKIWFISRPSGFYSFDTIASLISVQFLKISRHLSCFKCNNYCSVSKILLLSGWAPRWPVSVSRQKGYL